MVWNADFLGFVKRVGSQSDQANDDDGVDRLSHRYTFALVMIFLVLVAGKQYVGQPIECWVPKEFSGDWQAYAENFCWIKNTYWVAHEEDLPMDHAVRPETEIGYYQWVPFILLTIGLAFNIPRAVWKLCNWHSGIRLQTIVELANKAAESHNEGRDVEVNTVVRYLEDTIIQIEKSPSFFSRLKRILCCFFTNPHSGSYLSSLYLLVKVLYFINVMVQLYLMSAFLGTDGFSILNELMSGRAWKESGHFPRVTLCDFSIRALGQTRKNYTVQCVLMINLFNEKIFLGLWLWYLLLSVLVLMNLFYWVWILFSTSQREHLIRHMLKSRNEYEENYERAIYDFVKRRLQLDGVFILRLIQSNSGEIVATDMVVRMWQKYKENSKFIDPNDRKPMLPDTNDLDSRDASSAVS